MTENQLESVLRLHEYSSKAEEIIRQLRAAIAIKEGIKTDFSQDYKDEIQRLAVLPKNWDSYGSPPPSMPALLAAERLLQSKAEIVPCPNGGVQLEWPVACAEVSFEPDGTQEFDPDSAADGWKRRSTEAREWFRDILGPEIKTERIRQAAQWGGPGHDDGHDRCDWVRMIERFTALADRPGNAAAFEIFEAQMMKVAALAIAAVQSSRRKRNV